MLKRVMMVHKKAALIVTTGDLSQANMFHVHPLP